MQGKTPASIKLTKPFLNTFVMTQLRSIAKVLKIQGQEKATKKKIIDELKDHVIDGKYTWLI